LPESSFLPTSDFPGALGLFPDDVVYINHYDYGHYIGIEEARKYIQANSSDHPWLRGNELGRFRIAPHWHGNVSNAWYDSDIDCIRTGWPGDNSSDYKMYSLPWPQPFPPTKHIHLDPNHPDILTSDGSTGENSLSDTFNPSITTRYPESFCVGRVVLTDAQCC
jgi:hypothetical protein